VLVSVGVGVEVSSCSSYVESTFRRLYARALGEMFPIVAMGVRDPLLGRDSECGEIGKEGYWLNYPTTAFGGRGCVVYCMTWASRGVEGSK